jgi:peptide-methionine (S)-S-oxide reductase
MGCFWCGEAPLSDLKGVSSAVSGYIGGHVKNPAYRAVCSGETGHAEAVRVTFDPAVISYSTLLDVFFTVHDPTQLNRQGNDVGTQYRSAIFYFGAEQRAQAEAKVRELAPSFRAPIVTQLEDAEAHVWYPAEDYHQCYAKKHPTEGYIVGVSRPKYDKAKARFGSLFKE